MKCNKCGIKIEKCMYGNPECLQKSTHWYCNIPPCGLGRVGLGCVDPCRVLKVNFKGNYGIGTIAPQTYIKLNAKSLSDAWSKLISLTTHILLEKIGIKYTTD